MSTLFWVATFGGGVSAAYLIYQSQDITEAGMILTVLVYSLIALAAIDITINTPPPSNP